MHSDKFEGTVQTTNQCNLATKFILLVQHKTLHYNKFEGADFKYDNSFFKWQSKNNQIRHILVQILFIFSLQRKTLHLGKFEGNFKYDNSFSDSFLNLPKETFFELSLKFFSSG